MPWDKIIGFHDCRLLGLEPDSTESTLTLRFETETGTQKSLRVNGVSQLRAEGLRMQNVVSRVMQWTGSDSDAPKQALTWVYGLAEGGAVASEDQLSIHLNGLQDGETRLLWLDPSRGAELGVHFTGDLEVTSAGASRIF